VFELPLDAHFPQKAFHEFLAVGVFWEDALLGYFAAEPKIVHQSHFPHSAFAQGSSVVVPRFGKAGGRRGDQRKETGFALDARRFAMDRFLEDARGRQRR
jgi:hypothetical protein